jgi:hypothetical protein
LIERLKRWARELKAQLLTLWIVRSHPDTPLLAKIAAALVVAAGLATPDIVGAAPNEIKVFTDELAAYGEYTLETHVNKASRAGSRAANRHMPLQVMPEYSYGIWHDWEFSLQLPAAFGDGANRLEGYRAELQYVAPHDGDDGFYWGFNFELARTERAGEAHFWNVEVMPILGYRTDRWHFAANPGIDKAVSGASRATNIQPAAKAAYRTFEKNYFGVEYYLDAGPLRHRLPHGEQSRVLYFAWDGKIGKSDINVGIGRGMTQSSDCWVLKMIYEIAF